LIFFGFAMIARWY